MKKSLLLVIVFLQTVNLFSQKLKPERTDNMSGDKIKSTEPEYIFSTMNNQYISAECIKTGEKNTSVVLRISTTNTVYMVSQGKPVILKLYNDSTMRLSPGADVISKLGGGISGNFGLIRYGVTIELRLSAKEKEVLKVQPIKLIRVYIDDVSEDYEMKSKNRSMVLKHLQLLDKE